jgi:hypothetical protein
MANNVTIPAQGVGSTTPLVETYQVGPASSQRQAVVVLGEVLVPTGSGTVAVITTGGTAVTVVSGPINGGYVTNPANLARQGIAAAEPLYVDPTTAPGSTDAAANGTCSALDPGQTYTIPGLASGQSLHANAATSGHKFTVVVW